MFSVAYRFLDLWGGAAPLCAAFWLRQAFPLPVVAPLAMPLRKVHPAQLGGVASNQGKYRAQITARDFGLAKLISGPYHSTKQRAFVDLQSIQAAAAEHTTRVGALQAMKQEADRLKEEAVAEREADRLKEEASAEDGGVELCREGYRSRFRHIEGGVNHLFQGPRRHDARRAQADIEVIRAAAAGKPTRAEQLEAMQAEAPGN